MTKTKYEVYNSQVQRYSFVTTTRNLEDCINLMIEKYDAIYSQWKLFCTIEGRKELVYLKDDTVKKPIIDNCTGENYPDIKSCAANLGIDFRHIIGHLGKNKNPKFSYA